MSIFNPKILNKEPNTERKDNYNRQKKIVNGKSYELFKIPQLGGKLTKEDYYNPDIFRTALELKTGMLFSQEITVSFESPEDQDIFEELNRKFHIKQKLQTGFNNSLIFRDAIFKFRYSKRKESLEIDRILPENWVAEYNENNVDQEAETNTILFYKDIKEEKYLLTETFYFDEEDRPAIAYEAFKV